VGTSPKHRKEQVITLTGREVEVLRCLTRGRQYKEIADELGVTIETVRQHIKNIYRKLNVNSRIEAVVKFLKK
jgi:two-component system, NarL family, response regulator LiaR